MMITDEEVEKYALEKGLIAPRVSLAMIEDFIESETYIRIEDTNITICLLKMKNEFTFIGESACISDDNYDQELGRRIARQKAFDKCWVPFGFLLASNTTGEFPNA